MRRCLRVVRVGVWLWSRITGIAGLSDLEFHRPDSPDPPDFLREALVDPTTSMPDAGRERGPDSEDSRCGTSGSGWRLPGAPSADSGEARAGHPPHRGTSHRGVRAS